MLNPNGIPASSPRLRGASYLGKHAPKNHNPTGLRLGSANANPSLVVDKASKQEIADTFQTIIAACEKGGTRVIDERQKEGERK